MSHYTTLTNALEAAIKTAWGDGVKVAKGRTMSPFSDTPRAVIVQSSPKKRSGGAVRSVKQEWVFDIVGFFDLPTSGDIEPVQAAKTDLLVQVLEPYTEALPVPASPGSFAGIAYLFHCSEEEWPEPVQEDEAYMVRVQFVCTTEVYS